MFTQNNVRDSMDLLHQGNIEAFFEESGIERDVPETKEIESLVIAAEANGVMIICF
jgi:hypothetical protein